MKNWCFENMNAGYTAKKSETLISLPYTAELPQELVIMNSSETWYSRFNHSCISRVDFNAVST